MLFPVISIIISLQVVLAALCGIIGIIIFLSILISSAKLLAQLFLRNIVVICSTIIGTIIFTEHSSYL